jgi:hypothetical protein
LRSGAAGFGHSDDEDDDGDDGEPEDADKPLLVLLAPLVLPSDASPLRSVA